MTIDEIKKTRVIQGRLKAWEYEFETNKHGWRSIAEKHIATLKKQLTRNNQV